MSLSRKSSLDPIAISQYQWLPFLNDAIESLSVFRTSPYPIHPDFLYKKEEIKYKEKTLETQAITWACSTKKIRQARAACIYAGELASVLNIVFSPFPHYELPFFGADFVTLPSGHLLALDLQPALKDDQIHNESVWPTLLKIHERWKDFFPSGGPIPKEAESFFSPAFLWTRLPLGSEGDQIISEHLRPAFQEYLQFYVELIKDSKTVSKERSLKILSGQKSYINYRAKKDPARGMLSRFFGNDWTERYINEVLFDL